MNKYFFGKWLFTLIALLLLFDVHFGLITYASNISPSCDSTTINSNSPRQTIYTKNGMLFRPDGSELVMRGINTLDVYYLTPNGNERIEAINRLADKGFNSIRIIWDIEDDPFNPILDKAEKLNELRKELEVCRTRNLSVMLTAHHFRYIQRKQKAGDRRKDFQFFDTYDIYRDHINYWTNDAKSLLDDFKDILILNIINEPSGGGTNKELWQQFQKQSIIDMRDGGITNCLAVDSWDWGKNFDILFKHGHDILNADVQKNTIFDIHAYYYPLESPYLSSISGMKKNILKTKELKLPFVFGEISERNFDNDPAFDVGALLQICNDENIGYMAYCLYSDDPTRKSHCLSQDNAKTFNNNWSNLLTRHGKTIFDYINEDYGRKLSVDSSSIDNSSIHSALPKSEIIGLNRIPSATVIPDAAGSATSLSIGFRSNSPTKNAPETNSKNPPLKSQEDKDAIYNILLLILSSSLMGNSYWLSYTGNGSLAIVRKGENGEPNKFLKPTDSTRSPKSNNKDAEIITLLSKKGYSLNNDGSISKSNTNTTPEIN